MFNWRTLFLCSVVYICAALACHAALLCVVHLSVLYGSMVTLVVHLFVLYGPMVTLTAANRAKGGQAPLCMCILYSTQIRVLNGTETQPFGAKLG